MQCRSVLTRIDALRTGELAPIEKHAVESHLKRCTSCGESTDDVESLAHVVKALSVAPPRSCCDAVKEQIADHIDRITADGGDVWVAFSERGIRMIDPAESLDDVRRRYAKRFGRILEPGTIPAALRRQVVDALNGEGVDRPRVDLEDAKELEHDVLQMLTRIPRGEVRTYAWVARQVGRPRAVRAVGNIVAKNAVPFLLPCHRVVPASGGTGQYAFGSEMKRDLLKREGCDIDQLDALAKEHVRYIGSRTTHVFCFPTCRGARRIHDENRIAFHDADEALEHGYRPCRVCQPAAA